MENILNTNVLVLNKMFQPINITTVKKAFIKLFKETAEIITVDEGHFNNFDINSWLEISKFKNEIKEYEWINKNNFPIRVPRVIREFNYTKLRTKRIKLTRKNIFLRDNFQCQYCGKKFDTKNLNIDHIIPRSKNGKNIWTNLVCTCFKCNNKKGNNTPEQAGLKLLKKPVKPKFLPSMNFTINNKKYSIWQYFLDMSYWNIELKE